MKLCPGCAAPIVEGSLFCDRCGQRVDVPVEDTTSCRSCQALLGVGARFCDTCGVPVLVEEEKLRAPARPRRVAEPEPRHWWMAGFSAVTLGLGIWAAIDGRDGNFPFGIGLSATVVASAFLSNLWTRVKSLPIPAKLLLWAVAFIGAVASAFFVVCLWISWKLLQLFFAWAGVDIGSDSPGIGETIRRASRRARDRRDAEHGSDWERILNAKSVGGERIVRDGGFTYIGGQRVMEDGGFTYVGLDRVIQEGGVLHIGDKRVTHTGGHLFVDGERVEE